MDKQLAACQRPEGKHAHLLHHLLHVVPICIEALGLLGTARKLLTDCLQYDLASECNRFILRGQGEDSVQKVGMIWLMKGS